MHGLLVRNQGPFSCPRDLACCAKWIWFFDNRSADDLFETCLTAGLESARVVRSEIVESHFPPCGARQPLRYCAKTRWIFRCICVVLHLSILPRLRRTDRSLRLGWAVFKTIRSECERIAERLGLRLSLETSPCCFPFYMVAKLSSLRENLRHDG